MCVELIVIFIKVYVDSVYKCYCISSLLFTANFNFTDTYKSYLFLWAKVMINAKVWHFNRFDHIVT